MDRRNKGLLLTLGVALLGLLLVGCVSRPDVTPAASPPTIAAVSGSEGDRGAEETVQPPLGVAARFPLPAPEREMKAQADDSACIECHTSEETLKQLAKDPEEEESLSEGEG